MSFYSTARGYFNQVKFIAVSCGSRYSFDSRCFIAMSLVVTFCCAVSEETDFAEM